MNRKLVLLILWTIVLVGSVQGLGIMPAYHEVEYKDSQQLSLTIINNEQKTLNTRLHVDETNKEYIHFKEHEFVVNQPKYTLDYELTLPDEMEPGQHTFDVIVFASEDNAEGQGATATASVALKHKIKVRVPYPEEHLTAQLFTKVTSDDVDLRVALHNTGSKALKGVFAEFAFVNPDGKVVEELSTSTVNLEPGEDGKLTASVENMLLGEYTVIATVYYANTQRVMEKLIQIGQSYIGIGDLGIGTFKLGAIAELDILLKNRWNREITDVVPSMRISDDEQEISSYEAQPIDMGAGQDTVVATYWDTVGVEEGEYTAVARVEYLDRATERTFNLLVSEDDIEVQDPLLGYAVNTDENETNMMYYVLLMILALLVVLFVMMYKMRAEMKK